MLMIQYLLKQLPTMDDTAGGMTHHNIIPAYVYKVSFTQHTAPIMGKG